MIFSVLLPPLSSSPSSLPLPASSPPPPPPSSPPSITTTIGSPQSNPHPHSVSNAAPSPSLRCSRASRGVLEWWAWVVLVLAVWVAARECHAHQETTPAAPLCPPKRGSTQKICSSMDLRNRVDALVKLCHCSIIEGYLHFVLQEQNDSDSAAKLREYTFPELREITEHLLVYRVFSLTTLRTLFPNLAVIRGEVLFYNYALVIYDTPSLVEVGLASLTSILRGSVRIERNPQLCHVTTVDWARITSRPLTENYINRNKPESECRPCPSEMECPATTRCGPGRCWGPGACQILCRSGCASGCVAGECCHEECVGGCLTPGNATTCLACRNYWDVEEGRCSSTCPPGKLKVSKHRCEKVKECPSRRALRQDTRECVWECPAGHENTTSLTSGKLCRKCKGQQCPRRCPGTNVSSVSHAQGLRGCTLIEGGLTILINGGENMQKELEENLSSIKEVEHYVKVFRSNITSLAFLSSLTRVGGHERLHGDYSVVILDNPNLQELWNASGLTIERGKILVHANPKLCLHRVHTLANQTGLEGLSETDVSPTSNGDKVPCNITPLRANVSTSPLYGTLTVTVEATQLPGVSVYYVSYMKTDGTISLYDSDQPCSEQGWATVEMSIVNSTGKENGERRGGGAGVRREEGEVGSRGAGGGGGRVISGTLVNLEPFTRYAVFVKTVSLDSSARGAQSEVMYATTSPYNPSEPEHIQWSSPNSSTLKLWWQPPRHSNGVIDHYLVTLVLLLDVPKIPASLDFCKEQERKYLEKNLQSDPRMRSMFYSDEEEDVEEEEDVDEEDEHYEEERDEVWAKEARIHRNETRLDGDRQDGEYSCLAQHNVALSSSSCCACPESSSLENDGDVLGQIAFEDFIMDSVYVKKAGRGRRRAQARLHEKDDFERDLSATYQPPRNAIRGHQLKTSTSRRNRNAMDDDAGIPKDLENEVKERHQPEHQEEGPGDDFPLYPAEVHEFPSQGGIRADYQLHEEDLQQYSVPYPNLDSVLLQQVRRTRSLHLTIHNLLHYSLYSVSIVACQAPKPLLPNTWMKLCSLHPAQTAAYTKPSASGDQIPAGSLRVILLNGTHGSLSLSWDPPQSPNGGVLAYVIKLHGPLLEERCVTHKRFQAQGARFELSDLDPGNYSVSVRVRSKAKFGPYSDPIFFVVPNPAASPATVPALGVVFSALLGVFGMVAAGLGCWWWRRYHSRYTIPDRLDGVEENPQYRGGFAPRERFREEFIIWREHLKVLQDNPLGKGFFGMVFEGELSHEGKMTRVAVKTHTQRATEEDIEQFLKEAAVMQDISCHHVVRLVGAVADYSPVYVVMELMRQGDLKSFLRRHPRHHVSSEKLVEMAVQAADGMAYLAEARLVHRDLAARNCLLDHNLVLKIGDFGLSRALLKSNYYRKEGQGVLPVKWMAPESLQHSVYSTHSDMWSYGVLLWEMATRGLTPYKNCTNEEVIRLVVAKYATLDRPRDSPPSFQRLMRQCWRYEPRERPTFLAVTKFLLKHTSAEFQERFEQVSYYHSRSSDYARYRRAGTAGYMSGGLKDSDDDGSDDIALMSSSSEESDEEIAKEGILRFRTPQGSPRVARTSPRSRRGGACTTLLGMGGTNLCRVAGGVTGPSDWSRAAAPSVLHFYTNVSPDAPRPGQVLCGAGQSSVVVHGADGEEQDLRYAQLALSTPSTPASGGLTPSTPASGGRTPLRTPGSTPHTPFLHPNTASFPSPSSPGVSGSLAPFLQSCRGESDLPSKSSSQNSLSASSPASRSSIPFYSNLARSLSTLVCRSAYPQMGSHRPLRRLTTAPHSHCGTSGTLKGSSKWLSLTKGQNTTIPSPTSTSSIPAKLFGTTHKADLTNTGSSKSHNATRVPSIASITPNEETVSSSPSSTFHGPPCSSSSTSEHEDAVLTLSSLPHRTKSKFFRCERVYINTSPRASGSLPDNFFRRLHAEHTEASLPTSRAESPKSPKTKSSRKSKQEHDPGDIEMT